MEDELLIEKFINGDRQAFNTLVWRWEKPIYNFILRYIGDSDQAKDLLQMTFIRAYKSLNKLNDHAKFSSWLYQIALNQCKDHFKTRKIERLDCLEIADEGHDHYSKNIVPIDPSDPPERQHHYNNTVRVLQKALMLIPEEQRVVIIMKEYHGLKFQEIGEILQVPINTIKARMYYGLSALQKLFKQWGLDREDFGYEL